MLVFFLLLTQVFLKWLGLSVAKTKQEPALGTVGGEGLLHSELRSPVGPGRQGGCPVGFETPGVSGFKFSPKICRAGGLPRGCSIGCFVSCGSRQTFPEARSLLQLPAFLPELSFHTSSLPVLWGNLLSLQAGLSLQNHPSPGWWTQAREGWRGAEPSLRELGKAVCASHSDSHCYGCTFYWMVSADTMCL